jgi:hypothetical protein
MRTVRAYLIVILGTLIGLITPQLIGAQSAERCFPATGYCISGPIRAYWERHGGLPVFGYPIGPLRHESVEGSWTGPVQWFERDRLEDHANEGKGVLAGRLGARALELQGAGWQSLPGDSAAIAGCRFFRETQLNLCEPFLSYWQNNGGLERFGYPLSRQREEQIEGQSYTVQYFERRRMELHPENEGTSSAVLLGLLGRELYSIDNNCTAWFFSPTPLLCPQAEPTFSDGAAQRFEHGVMIWMREPDTFYIMRDTGEYWVVRPPYSFVDAPPITAAPPAGRYVPVSGFGDLWSGRMLVGGPSPLSEPLHQLLGWATEPEREIAVATQCQRARSYYEQGCYVGSADGPIIFFGPGNPRIIR